MRDESRDYTRTIQYEHTLECTVTVMMMMMTMTMAFVTVTLKTKKKVLQLHLIKFFDIVYPFQYIRNNKFSRLTSFTAV
jgi:hypothetical protein